MKTEQNIEGNQLTPEQKALWVGLKDCRLAGRKFNIRNRNNDDTIDFFCPSENLIVEIGNSLQIIKGQTIPDLTNDASRRILQFPINRIRVDLGLVLAQIRGHFDKMAVIC